MKYKYHIIPLFVFFLLEPAALILAQSGGYAGSFQRMGFGPRGMAMGNAMTAVSSEGIYGHYNPALAADPSNPGKNQFDIATAAMQFDRNLHMAGVHFHLPPSAGIGFQLINATVSGIDGRTSSGYHTGMLSANEYQLNTQFAIRFHESIWGGIGLKLTMADFHQEVNRPVSFGGDLGIRVAFTPRFVLGFTVQDLLSAYQWDTSELFGDDFQTISSQSFPIRIKSGLSYEFHEQVLVAIEYEYRINPAGFEIPDPARNSSFARIGSRYSMHERVTLRGGLRIIDLESEAVASLSAGFSLKLPLDRFSPSVDYAFVQEPNRVANLHVFALRLLI